MFKAITSLLLIMTTSFSLHAKDVDLEEELIKSKAESACYSDTIIYMLKIDKLEHMPFYYKRSENLFNVYLSKFMENDKIYDTQCLKLFLSIDSKIR